MEEQQKLEKKSLEIQVEEKQVAEIKNKVQTVKKSLEVAKQQHQADTALMPNIRDGMSAEMNDVTIAAEVTSVKTTPMQRRRSRENRNEHRDWCAIRN